MSNVVNDQTNAEQQQADTSAVDAAIPHPEQPAEPPPEQIYPILRNSQVKNQLRLQGWRYHVRASATPSAALCCMRQMDR